MNKIIKKIKVYVSNNKVISFFSFLLLARMIDSYIINLPNLPYAFSYIISSLQYDLFNYELMTEILFLEGAEKNKMYVALILLVIIYVAVIYVLRTTFTLAGKVDKSKYIELPIVGFSFAVVLALIIVLSMFITNQESWDIMGVVYVIYGVTLLLALSSEAKTENIRLIQILKFFKKGKNILIFCCTFLLVGTVLSHTENSNDRLFVGTKPSVGYFYINENKSLINSIYYNLKIPDSQNRSDKYLFDVMKMADGIQNGGYMLGNTCLLGETNTKYYVTTFTQSRFCGNLKKYKVVEIDKREGLKFVFGHMPSLKNSRINQGILLYGKEKDYFNEGKIWEILMNNYYRVRIEKNDFPHYFIPSQYISVYKGEKYVDKLWYMAFQELILKGDISNTVVLEYENQIQLRSQLLHRMLLKGNNKFIEEYHVKYEDVKELLVEHYYKVDIGNEEKSLLYLDSIFNKDILVEKYYELNDEIRKKLPSYIRNISINPFYSRGNLVMITENKLRYDIPIDVLENRTGSGIIFNISSLEDNISIENPDIYY